MCTLGGHVDLHAAVIDNMGFLKVKTVLDSS